MIEVCHQIERHAQPVPFRNQGGDCFACALAAALPFLYPEMRRDDGGAISADGWFEMAYARFMNGRMSGSDEPILDNSFKGFKQALDQCSRLYGRLEVAYHMPEPHFHQATWRDEGHHGWAFQLADDAYTRTLEGLLRGGWVAFTTVDLDGEGPTIRREDGVWLNTIDHFLLLDGVRMVYEEELNDDGSFRSGTWNDYVHVVDSSTRDISGWHRIRPFLLSYGACSWWIARRDTR